MTPDIQSATARPHVSCPACQTAFPTLAPVAEAVSDPALKWTTQKVLAHLQRIGFPLKAKKPIYSVGQSLNILTEQKRIKLIRQGFGSTPNVYGPLNPQANEGDHSQGEAIKNEN